MSLPIIWSKQAISDFREIITYLSPQNIRAADEYRDKIIDIICSSITEYPEIYRTLTKAKYASICPMPYPYKITYKINRNHNNVRILRIIHGRRNFPGFD